MFFKVTYSLHDVGRIFHNIQKEEISMALYAIGAGVLLFWAVASSIALMVLLRRIGSLDAAQHKMAQSGLSHELLGSILQTIANETIAPLHSLVILLPEHIELGKKVQSGLDDMKARISDSLDAIMHGKEDLEAGRRVLEEHLGVLARNRVEQEERKERLEVQERELKTRTERFELLRAQVEREATEKGIIGKRFRKLDLD